RWLALINPYLALKNLSMALCGTDFESYVQFQNQAEDYRYKLAQKMNRLQMDYIAADVSSSEGKKNVVDRNEWKSFADFEHDFMSVGGTLESEAVALISLLLWLALSYFAIIYTSQKAKAI
ncbi:ABC transporter permease, partial [Marivirga lumbricoides]